MTEITERLHLPLLQVAQAQKEVTHNEALLRLDRWSHPRVASRTVAVPPAEAETGRAWIVPDDADGGWAGRAGQIAEWDGRWKYMTPAPGLLIWLEDENALVLYDGTGWGGGLPVAGLSIGRRTMLSNAPETVTSPIGGAVIDIEARAAIDALLANFQTLGLVAAGST
jgi:hypothetical protein|tara:strand:- start:78621 stop:79124 length:504 start_codon:yes stop_codon:yes gene_type:complete